MKKITKQCRQLAIFVILSNMCFQLFYQFSGLIFWYFVYISNLNLLSKNQDSFWTLLSRYKAWKKAVFNVHQALAQVARHIYLKTTTTVWRFLIFCTIYLILYNVLLLNDIFRFHYRKIIKLPGIKLFVFSRNGHPLSIQLAGNYGTRVYIHRGKFEFYNIFFKHFSSKICLMNYVLLQINDLWMNKKLFTLQVFKNLNFTKSYDNFRCLHSPVKLSLVQSMIVFSLIVLINK